MKEPSVKITIRVFESDLEKLKLYYPRLGYNKVLRELVRKHVQDLDYRTGEILREEEQNVNRGPIPSSGSSGEGSVD